MSEYYVLRHHGIKGMHWGIRRYQNPDGSLTEAGKLRYKVGNDGSLQKLTRAERKAAANAYGKDRYHVEQQAVTNPDGSKTLPAGYAFNRVGGAELDFNDAGGLYVSDASSYDVHRYITQLGPTAIGKLTGEASYYVKTIEATKPIKVCSEEQFHAMTLEALCKNRKTYDFWAKSIYSWGIPDEQIPSFKKLSSVDPKSELGKKISARVCAMYGNSVGKDYVEPLLKYYKANGWDAIPDVYDRSTGASENPMLIVNKDAVRQTTKEYITKDILKTGRKTVKEMGSLPLDEAVWS